MSSVAERLLDHAELVVFRVLQHDAVVAHVRLIHDPKHAGADFDQSSHCGGDPLRADRQRDVAPAADPQVGSVNRAVC